MILTSEIVLTVVTAIMTYLFGILSKKINLIDSEYIPAQNFAIGLLTGIICYLVGLTDTNLITTLILSIFGSMTAGGTYDLTQTKIKNDESEG